MEEVAVTVCNTQNLQKLYGWPLFCNSWKICDACKSAFVFVSPSGTNLPPPAEMKTSN